MYKLCNLKYHQSVLLSALVFTFRYVFSRVGTRAVCVNLSEPDDLHWPMRIFRAVEWKFLQDVDVLHVFQVVHATELRNNVQVPGK